jgi:hypothetical protein
MTFVLFFIMLFSICVFSEIIALVLPYEERNGRLMRFHTIPEFSISIICFYKRKKENWFY